MQDETYIYYCMDCDYSWESEYNDETICRKCGCGDLALHEGKQDD